MQLTNVGVLQLLGLQKRCKKFFEGRLFLPTKKEGETALHNYVSCFENFPLMYKDKTNTTKYQFQSFQNS
jgi:hypothetical protein